MSLTKITTNSLKEQGVQYINLHPDVVTAFLTVSGGTVNGSLSTVGDITTSNLSLSGDISIATAYLSGAITGVGDATLGIRINDQQYWIPIFLPGNIV
jgi:hypothetical protein